MAKHTNIASYIRNLNLIAHSAAPQCHEYDNYLLAKGFNGSSIAAACSRLLNLTILTLSCFQFEQSRTFFHSFAKHFSVPKLCHFNMRDSIIRDSDLALIIKTHKSTLHAFDLDEVDLHGGMNDMTREVAEDCGWNVGKQYRTPWSTVFEAMLEVEDECCGFDIRMPKQFGTELDIIGPEW
jgi:hypothetical protein